MRNKILLLVVVSAVILSAAYLLTSSKSPLFKGEVLGECCMEPACTMCYEEENIWNDFKAGNCKCDELEHQGKPTCPECHNAECDSEENQSGASCEI